MLLLHEKYKLKQVDIYDEFITAEIPDPVEHPRLYEYVQKHMIHGPCHLYRSCLRDGNCKKYFPKNYEEVTRNSKSGFPTYRRRKNGHTCKSILNENVTVDNAYVVPYNPGLLLKYNCHINVEICSTIQAIKYVYKYVYKGPDKAFVSVAEGESEASECQRFLNARSIGPSEACYRIFGFPINGQKPFVKDLIIHLPNQQNVYYNDKDNHEDINLNQLQNNKTQLLEYFNNNKKEKRKPLKRSERGFFRDGTVRPHGFQLRYIDYPQFYHWQKGKWVRRSSKPLIPVVGRMHYVNYKQRERYYLRVLLGRIAGATSFEQLKTVNGVICESFRDACCKLGFLDDDTEWDRALEEACGGVILDCEQLRMFFATILNNNDVNDAKALWQKYKRDLSADIKRDYYNNTNIPRCDQDFTQQMYNECLFRIEEHLQSSPDKEGTLEEYGLPSPSRKDRIDMNALPAEIQRELHFDKDIQSQLVDENVKFMKNNPQQLQAYNTILQRVYQPKPNESKFLFLQASAGTGKTFVSNTVAASIRAKGDIALCCATSGIAANLFVNGRTMHSRFKIPLDCQKYSPLTIKKQTALAELIRRCKIIIWDEAPMAHKNILFWLDRQFRDIMGNNEPFGGKTLLLCGDFKQLPPVIPRGSRRAVMAASIKTSPYFQNATILKLVKNERLRKQLLEHDLSLNEKQKLKKFDKWITNIGYNKVPKRTNIHGQAIKLDPSYIANCPNLTNFIDQIYSEMNQRNDANYFKNRCILTTLNENVKKINSLCLDKFQSVVNDSSSYQNKTYASDDSVGLDDVEAMFSKEWLNEQEYNGIPLHKLKLKVGAPVILLRNVNPAEGLCNGTRLIIKELHDYSMHCVVMSNPNKSVYLPRMILSPSSNQAGFDFKRRQFPISLAFAMTINKSQGQTMKHTAIYLPAPVFEHGQLYVAVSRVTSPDNLKIFVENSTHHGYIDNEWITKNVVYEPLLV